MYRLWRSSSRRYEGVSVRVHSLLNQECATRLRQLS